MTEPKFNIIFSVNVFHSYFKQGTCNCLLFTPSPATHSLIKRFGFKIRKEINGFGFYTNSPGSIPDILNYIQQVTDQSCFEFEIENINSNFNIFTELPVNWIGKLLYDSNNRSTADQQKQIILNADFQPENSTAAFGNLKINFDDLIQCSASGNPCQFEIHYQARATQWQYYIINKSAVHMENAMITGKSEIYFNGPGHTIIQSGENALLFSSGEQLIPLSEIPVYKFDLINISNSSNTTAKNGNTSKTIFKGLPNPDPGRIGTAEINGEKKVTSPMYVYV